MRKLLIATGLVAILVSPALAQSYSGGYGTGNIGNTPAQEHGFAFGRSANEAFAAAPRPATPRRARAEAVSPNDPDTVYESGQYVGRDPDPNVRLELRRDWTHD